MRYKLICFVIYILICGCQDSAHKMLTIEDWNRQTQKIKKDNECPVETFYNVENFLNAIRLNEIDIINNLIELNNIDYIIESAMINSLLEAKLKIIDKKGIIHIFDYQPLFRTYQYLGSKKFNGTLSKSFYSCETYNYNYQYFYIQTRVSEGEIINVNIIYN